MQRNPTRTKRIMMAVVGCCALLVVAVGVVGSLISGGPQRAGADAQVKRATASLTGAGFTDVVGDVHGGGIEDEVAVVIDAVLPNDADISTAAAALVDPPAKALSRISIDCGAATVRIETYRNPDFDQPSVELVERLLDEGRRGPAAAILVVNYDPLSGGRGVVVSRRAGGDDIVTALRELAEKRAGFGAIDRVTAVTRSGANRINVDVTADHVEAAATLLAALDDEVSADVKTIEDPLVAYITPPNDPEDAERHLKALPQLPAESYEIHWGRCVIDQDQLVTCN